MIAKDSTAEHGSTAANVRTSLDHQPSPKWAALIGDKPFPMPRRKLPVEVILAQSEAPPGHRLVRDLNSPVDVAFSSGAEVDLAEGNVFRLVEGCPHQPSGATGAPPKLAFFVDDAWEVTVVASQNDVSIRGLFDLDAGIELFRDFESPSDEPIGAGSTVLFRDGPVLRTGDRQLGLAVTTRILGTTEPSHRFRIPRLAPMLMVMQTGAHRAGVALLPDATNPLDRLHNVRGQHVGEAISDLDESLQHFLRRPGTTRDFGIELVLAIRVNALWAVATAASMNPRQILALFGLDPTDYSLYRGTSVDPLPPDTAIALRRGDAFEAQRDGKYGARP